jgi:MFS family permease
VVSALRHRPFAVLWSGQALSSVGDCFYAVAIAGLLLEHGAGAGTLGVVMSARAVGTAAASLLGGWVADRLSPVVAMLSADVVRGGMLVTLAGAAGSVPVVWIAVMTLVIGLGESVFVPAYTAVMAQVAPAGGLRSANALTAMARNGAQVAGPVAAGLVVAAWGAQAALAADAATFAASITTLLVLARSMPLSRGAAQVPLNRQALLAGWSEVLGRPWLAWSIASAITALCLGLAPLLILLPLLGRDYTTGSGGYATLLAGFGAGTVVGAAAAARLGGPRRGVLAQAGIAVVAVPMAFLAVPGSVIAAVAAVAVAGAGYGLFGVVWTTALQEQVPAAVLGRVAAVDTALGLGAMPLGYLLGGQLAHWAGPHLALALLAPAAAAAALAPLAVQSVRSYAPAVARPAPAEAAPHPQGRV